VLSIPWRQRGLQRYSCTHFNAGARWRWAITFTTKPLYF